MERVLWRGDLLFCFKTQSKNTLLPLDQFSSTELSEMMEMFYICTVGSNSHSPPTKSHVWLVAIMFDDTNLDTQIYIQTILFWGGNNGKNANAGDTRDAGSIPGLGRCPGGRHGNPLQYSFLEKSKDRGAWGGLQSMGSQSQTPLSVNTHTHTHIHTHVFCFLGISIRCTCSSF